ncbi:MAG: cyanophycinase [Pseudomonadota bacterium]
MRRLAFLFLLLLGTAHGAPGTLVIVGGGLDPANTAVYRSFIDALPDPANDRIAVLATASGEPALSAEAFTAALARHGVPAERVDLVKLAVRDDESTRTVDESAWAGNAASPTEIAKIERAGGIWMTGGDQRRLTALLRPDGKDAPMLKALRKRLEEGAVVGGTSAGAAVMSDPMITGGDPLLSLTRRAGEPADDRVLGLGPGFGLLLGLTVDQHFGERARLGRLTLALATRPEAERLGFGIDEDTALVADLENGTLAVAGAGNITVIDGRRATFAAVQGQFAVLDARLSVLTAGDRYMLANGETTIDESRKPTVGDEYFDEARPGGGGMALPQPRLARLLGEALLDNSATTTLRRVSFREDGRGFVYQFEQDDEAAGYWGRNTAGRSRYSITGAGFSIAPATIDIRVLQTEVRR